MWLSCQSLAVTSHPDQPVLDLLCPGYTPKSWYQAAFSLLDLRLAICCNCARRAEAIMKRKYALSSAVEQACSTLAADFELTDELCFTLSVQTSWLPFECLDALGIPEAQPVQLHWKFASHMMAPDRLPSIDVTYCGQGRTLPTHRRNKPVKATPYDKFLHQVCLASVLPGSLAARLS